MNETKFEEAGGVAGTPEGDGDFETDQLPDTGETSAGGQVSTTDDTRDGTAGRSEAAESKGGLKHLAEELGVGKILP
jgi:hypothetical protein